LVRVTTGGSTSSIFNPFNSINYNSAFTRGADGNPWFTVSGTNQIATYNIASNSLRVLFPPTGFSASYGIAAGPDGNIWALDTLGKTDVYIINILSVSPKTLTFTSHGQTLNLTVTEPGTTAWTATSSNVGVATVKQGTSANVFNVTSVAHGTCTVTISAMNNSFPVKVTVP
jgi:virginiamycin B lyase